VFAFFLSQEGWESNDVSVRRASREAMRLALASDAGFNFHGGGGDFELEKINLGSQRFPAGEDIQLVKGRTSLLLVVAFVTAMSSSWCIKELFGKRIKPLW